MRLNPIQCGSQLPAHLPVALVDLAGAACALRAGDSPIGAQFVAHV
jgi:hypothetical protein